MIINAVGSFVHSLPLNHKATKNSPPDQPVIFPVQQAGHGIDLKAKSIKVYSGEPSFAHEKPVVQIPKQLKSLTSNQKKILEEMSLNDFQASMLELEDSMVDAVFNTPEIHQKLDQATARLSDLIKAYARVLSQKHSTNYELMTYRILHDSYFAKGAEKIKTYRGNVGSNPLTLIDVLNKGNFREKVYFLVQAKKTIMRDIIDQLDPITGEKDPSLIEKINSKLTEQGASFAINTTKELFKKFNDDGLYANQTKSLKLRIEEHDPEKALEKNPTLKTARSLLKIKPSSREERYATRNPIVTSKDDNTRMGWTSGAAIFKPVKADDPHVIPNDYLNAAKDLRLNLVGGISGTTDHILSIVNILGLDTKEDMYLIQLACLGWFLDSQSHSVYEILTAGKSFGIHFHASPDFYKRMDPTGSSFLERLETMQKDKGLPMPAECLGSDHVLALAKKLGYAAVD